MFTCLSRTQGLSIWFTWIGYRKCDWFTWRTNSTLSPVSVIEADQIDFVNWNSIAVAIVDPMAVVIATDSDFVVVILEKCFKNRLIFRFPSIDSRSDVIVETLTWRWLLLRVSITLLILILSIDSQEVAVIGHRLLNEWKRSVLISICRENVSTLNFNGSKAIIYLIHRCIWWWLCLWSKYSCRLNAEICIRCTKVAVVIVIVVTILWWWLLGWCVHAHILLSIWCLTYEYNKSTINFTSPLSPTIK